MAGTCQGNHRVNLVENETGKLVWSWEPDQWKTCNSAEKAIKWLARHSARKMHRAGLFGSRFIQ